MLCAVYKSLKKADTYLYVENKNDFSKVPKALLEVFGTPEFVMLVPTGKRERLAKLPMAEFLEKLNQEGFYLQMPPKVISLLAQHKGERETS